MVDRTARESHFPAIEKRYGEPMSFWLKEMKKVKGKPYQVQMNFLQENFGFSRAHANTLIMYCRGSLSSRRHQTPKDYFLSLDSEKARTMKQIFRVIQDKYPNLELVIAWNQPMLKLADKYVFGCSASKNHLTIAPWDSKVLEKLESKLDGYVVNKKTVQVPIDWKIDERLLIAMIRETLKTL